MRQTSWSIMWPRWPAMYVMGLISQGDRPVLSRSVRQTDVFLSVCDGISLPFLCSWDSCSNYRSRHDIYLSTMDFPVDMNMYASSHTSETHTTPLKSRRRNFQVRRCVYQKIWDRASATEAHIVGRWCCPSGQYVRHSLTGHSTQYPCPMRSPLLRCSVSVGS